jgi:hypothetical protein
MAAVCKISGQFHRERTSTVKTFLEGQDNETDFAEDFTVYAVCGPAIHSLGEV